MILRDGAFGLHCGLVDMRGSHASMHRKAHLVVGARFAGRLEQLVRGADIDVTLTVEHEVVA